MWILELSKFVCIEGVGRQRKCELLSEATFHETLATSGSQVPFVQKQFPFLLLCGCWSLAFVLASGFC